MKPKRFMGYRVLWLLMSTKEPWTIHEVAHELGVATNCAYRHLKELWSLDFIHICNWDRTYRHLMPVYRWGKNVDKEKPAPGMRIYKNRRPHADPIKNGLKRIAQYDGEKRRQAWREAMLEDAAHERANA